VPIYERIRQILESARTSVARSVNTTQVIANWLIGREIVEEEQKGKAKAEYGERLLEELSEKLQVDFGNGYSIQNLRYIRQFYLTYPNFIDELQIRHALRDEFATITKAFYEIEALKNNWSARELERQINSLLYERLAKSRDKAGLLKLAAKGHEIQQPADVFKDPVVIEFLGLPESPRLVESKLEEALISNLQDFLLELGKGFAFVSRQERITLEGDHFYIDLVFYHTVLKCYVLIDLKVGKLSHGDLGQLQLYVNYYDQERRTAGDNPTLGLILCTDKNEAVVKYARAAPGEKDLRQPL